MKKMLIIIEKEVVEVEDIQSNGFGGYHIDCNNGAEYHVFADRDAAGEGAADYWRDMAANDKSEFRCIVGDDALISWALGEYGGPGNEKVKSLDEWFELTANYPEEQWASYDGDEIEGARFNNHFAEAMGIDDRKNIVLYRCN
jgi:hypothetical protein